MAEGASDKLAINTAFSRIDTICHTTEDWCAAAVWGALIPNSREGAVHAYQAVEWSDDYSEGGERRGAYDWLRCIFGNPFRSVAFAPWRTDTATAPARGMYESRDFGAMPILADALQDAGCDNADVLAHCRDPHAAHVRGCWVVDGVLGKE